MFWIILAFIVVPIIEMIVLIEVGSRLGSVTTVFLVFLTAIIGVFMLKQQGISTLLRFNEKLNSGELPATEMLGGVFLFLAGAFLLTPGFVTDSMGFALLIPSIRHSLAQYLIDRGTLSAVSHFENSEFYRNFQQDRDFSGEVYEAEQEDVPEEQVLIEERGSLKQAQDQEKKNRDEEQS